MHPVNTAKCDYNNVVPEISLDLVVDRWLETVKMSHVTDWEVLMFLYRHGTSLSSAEQIAVLVGHKKSDVGKALDTLGDLGLIQRSRSSQGVRIYRFILPANTSVRGALEQLLKLSEKRNGRLIVARSLQKRAVQVPSGGRSATFGKEKRG